MPPTQNRAKMRSGIEARNEARRRLQEEHAARFKELVEEERIKRGLPRTPSGATADELRQKIQREQERLARLQQELELAEAYS